jgi:hypothetical protein
MIEGRPARERPSGSVAMKLHLILWSIAAGMMLEAVIVHLMAWQGRRVALPLGRVERAPAEPAGPWLRRVRLALAAVVAVAWIGAALVIHAAPQLIIKGALQPRVANAVLFAFMATACFLQMNPPAERGPTWSPVVTQRILPLGCLLMTAGVLAQLWA